MVDLSQTVFVWSANEAFKWMNTHIYTHTHTHTQTHMETTMNAIGKNAMHCILLKNQAIG